MRKIIVVGAVAVVRPVPKIRRLDKDSEITIFEKDRDMSFANCGLPYFIGNIVNERKDVLPITPDVFKRKERYYS